ncbi:tetratricopeptide repeat protein [Hymenobacter sp. BT770]|uniref:tetratricopeptide repeat protein n=1 Tax=Hymenobacter sp. BT770 TaxID=2886942 RepID=UPI001D11A738|nr:tetratricopeptide repeat protein [Hymenobacter sp. BT770]MCC3152327.1 tetratricopeptide repeat protein [Hymenobacter sp. BT770]MDO3414140.1 tetratricopeptide repeat protein [Hymenobacter sp. BT770]
MKRLLLWVITLTLCQGCQAQSQQEQLKEFSAAEQALSAGNSQEAIRRFDAILKNGPESERALLLRCKAKYKLQDYQGAIKDAQQILAINPTVFSEQDYLALLNLGICNNNLRQFEQARQYFLQAQKADSTDVRISEGLGYGFLEEHDFARAIKNFSHAVEINPASKTIFYGLGKSYLHANKYPEAIKAYDQAIKLDPTYAVAYQNRASAKYLIQDLNGCCADLKRCEELGVNNTQVAAFREKVCH